MDEHLTGVFAWSACCLLATSVIVWWLYNDSGFATYAFNIRDAVVVGLVLTLVQIPTMRWLDGPPWIAYPLCLSYWCSLGFAFAFLGRALMAPDLTMAPLGASICFAVFTFYQFARSRTIRPAYVEIAAIGIAALALSTFVAWRMGGNSISMGIAAFGSIGTAAVVFADFHLLRSMNRNSSDNEDANMREVMSTNMILYFHLSLLFIVILELANRFGGRKKPKR